MKRDIEKIRAEWHPRKNTGKTRFNRGKAKGESWTALRAIAWGLNYTCKESWTA